MCNSCTPPNETWDPMIQRFRAGALFKGQCSSLQGTLLQVHVIFLGGRLRVLQCENADCFWPRKLNGPLATILSGRVGIVTEVKLQL